MRKAMRQRLQDEGFAGFKVAQLLVLPGHTLASTPVGFPRERIVDAKDAPELCHRVLRVINRGRQNARIRPDGRVYCFFGETRTLSIAIYDRVQAFDMAGAHIMALVLAALGACRTWGVESENRPQRGQFLPDLHAHSPAMGQKDGKKWTAAVDLQPTIPKSDRLLAFVFAAGSARPLQKQ